MGGSFRASAEPSAGGLERSIGAAVLRVGGIGLDFEDVIAIAEPVVGGFLDGSGRGGLDALEIGLVAIGIAGKVWQRARMSLLPPKPPMRSMMRA